MENNNKMYNLFITSTNRYCYARTMLGAPHTFAICTECGRKNIHFLPISEQASLLIEGGKRFPDFLSFGDVGQYFLVSDTVVSVFEANAVSGYYVEKALPVYREVRGELQKVDDIQYFLLKVIGKVDFDLKAMHLKKKCVCKSCGRFDWSIQKLSIVDTKLDMNTWDQCDICRVSSSPGFIVCSEKVANLINQKKLTGVYIQNEKDIFRNR